MMPFSTLRRLGSMVLGFLLPALLMTGVAFAAERVKVALPQTRPLLWECVIDAAHKNGLPLAALVGILAAEGGEPGEALSNANGTWDMGPFQINTCHVNELVGMGIAPETVCVTAVPTPMRRHGCSARNTSGRGTSGKPWARTIPGRRNTGMPT